MAALISATSATPKSFTFFCKRGNAAAGDEAAATVLAFATRAAGVTPTVFASSAALKAEGRPPTANRKAAAATPVTATLPRRERTRWPTILIPLQKAVAEFARIRPL